MNTLLRRISPFVFLLACLFPSQAFGQEIVRLFDVEVDEHLAPDDLGQLVPGAFWHMGNSGIGLFDQTAVLAELPRPQLLVLEGNDLFLVDDDNGARVLVYSLPDLDLVRSFGGSEDDRIGGSTISGQSAIYEDELHVWGHMPEFAIDVFNDLDDGTIYVLTYGQQGWELRMLRFPF